MCLFGESQWARKAAPLSLCLFFASAAACCDNDSCLPQAERDALAKRYAARALELLNQARGPITSSRRTRWIT